MLLSSKAALARFADLKQELQREAGGSMPREALVQEALQRLSFSILWPFRIVMAMSEDRSPLYHVVLNHGAQGLDEEIWTMRGWHREKDVIRLAVTFRNLLYFAGDNAARSGEIDGGLAFAMREVQAVMNSYPDVDEDAS